MAEGGREGLGGSFQIVAGGRKGMGREPAASPKAKREAGIKY